MKKVCLGLLFLLSFDLVAAYRLPAASFDQLIASAKNEGDLGFVAGAATFGNKKGVSELEAAFNKKFGLKARVQLTASISARYPTSRIFTNRMLWKRSIGLEYFHGSPRTWSFSSMKASWFIPHRKASSTTQMSSPRIKRRVVTRN